MTKECGNITEVAQRSLMMLFERWAKIEAISSLLIEKGIITEDELLEKGNKIQEKYHEKLKEYILTGKEFW
ncbi:hypothetical protein GT50_01320 [Geobacillus stearothermophilus 10]|nr:hypothetical protein GT50_01320 [Geobacillus stearothermophilus 10]